MRNKKLMLILVLMLVVGFASVSTTLVLNGNIGISNKKEDFNIIFTSATVKGNINSTAEIGEDKKTITFDTDKLSVVGDTSELIYKVKNNSTQYDANVSINCTGGNEEYLNIVSEFAGNTLPLTAPVLMRAQEVRMGKISVELKKASTEEHDINIACTLVVDGEERESIKNYEEDKYTEYILNGADPVIKSGLIPVTIENDGTVKKANTTEEWYSYENKKWANAVVLKDSTSKEYNLGDIIEENDIKQYYVWIPRYRYQLWNVDSNVSEGAEQAINIVFENKDNEVSNGTKNGEWLTHPAFTSFDTNGIWVGKFETSYDEASFTNSSVFATSNPNTSSVKTGSNIIIKPNVRSLTAKNVSTFYTLGREVNSSLNSHMMKNSEWGATAYLTYSLYGKCTESGCEEVSINNVNTGYSPASSAIFTGQWQYGGTITGCSGTSASASVVGSQSSCAENYAWNSSSNKASTTGNISGIYDMSGGNWEYVMGVIKDESGNPMSGKNNLFNSGFNGTYGGPTSDNQSILSKTNGIDFPSDTRYYDLYEANSTTLGDDTWNVYINGHLGDATKEVAISKTNSSSARGLWFNDNARFITTLWPWFDRGGSYNDHTIAGIFDFNKGFGSNHPRDGFRVVLAI